MSANGEFSRWIAEILLSHFLSESEYGRTLQTPAAKTHFFQLRTEFFRATSGGGLLRILTSDLLRHKST